MKMRVFHLLLMVAFMAALTLPLIQGHAPDEGRTVVKLKGRCIVAKAATTVLQGPKTKEECLTACRAIESAKGCQYRKGNNLCKVVMESFEKANFKLGNGSYRQGVTCWRFTDGPAHHGERAIIKLEGRCIVAKAAKTVLRGPKTKKGCLTACRAIESAKGCQYRTGNKMCKVVMESFEKAEFKQRVTCWRFTDGPDNTLLFLGPGRGTSGQSEVFIAPSSENNNLTSASCTVPQYPITDIWVSVGFVHEDTLHICGGRSDSSNPESQSACFSLINSTWSETTPMLTERSGAAAVKMNNGSVLVSGGSPGLVWSTWSDLSTSFLQTSELLTGSTWTPSIQLPSQRSSHCMLQLSTGELFLHGGYSGSMVNDTHISKDHENWEKVMSSQNVMAYHACTEVIINSDQQVWVGEGSITEIFHMGTLTWTNGPALPGNCFSSGKFFTYNGKLFYAYGSEKNIYQLKNNWQTQQDAWIKIGEMSETRQWFPALLITEDVCKGVKPTPTTTGTTTSPHVQNAASIPPV